MMSREATFLSLSPIPCRDRIINKRRFIWGYKNHKVGRQYMEQQQNPETSLQAASTQEPASVKENTNVLRRHIKEEQMKTKLAQHRLWMDSIQHEYPMPYTPYKIGVYIRYNNQIRYANYLE